MNITADQIVHLQEILEGHHHASIRLVADIGDPPVGSIITAADGRRFEVEALSTRASGSSGAEVQARPL